MKHHSLVTMTKQKASLVPEIKSSWNSVVLLIKLNQVRLSSFSRYAEEKDCPPFSRVYCLVPHCALPCHGKHSLRLTDTKDRMRCDIVFISLGIYEFQDRR